MIAGSLPRHSSPTVGANRERLSAPLQRFAKNQAICRKNRPMSVLRSWRRIPVAVLPRPLLVAGGFVLLGVLSDRMKASERLPSRNWT